VVVVVLFHVALAEIVGPEPVDTFTVPPIVKLKPEA
jgi:hypothetical protein